MREWIFAAWLALAAIAVVVGVAGVSHDAAWIVGGVLFAAWGYLMLGEVGTT